MPTPANRLIIPLLNFGTTLFALPRWHLSDSVYVAQIDDQDFATLLREAESQYGDWLKARTICINFEDPPTTNFAEKVRAHAISAAFVFNAFSAGSPAIVSKAAYLSKNPTCRHENSFDLQTAPIGAAMASTAFALKPLESPEPLTSLFKIVEAVVSRNPAVLVTLDRFNTSLLRSNIYDQIIDITISLESVVESSTEISFRFSLYNALLSEPETAKRRATFDILKKLYEARSLIVHGDISSSKALKKIDYVKQNFKEVQKLAVAVISYYLMFHFKEPKKSWEEHLVNLALGTETRVTT